ncbi:MAG: hypothetical protein IJL26_12945 [Clostridia bacterium]|nr:hypothetical protein [Clostridia bacterium]
MTVLLNEPTRVSVALTGEDMARLGITYDTIGAAAPRARRAILSVFDEACRRAGVVPRLDGGLLVETLPGSRSGCILIFSARQTRDKRYYCRINDTDSFLDCVSRLRSETLRAEAYLYRDAYYIFPRGDAPGFPFSEYGEVSADESGLALARLAEFGRRLNIG